MFIKYAVKIKIVCHWMNSLSKSVHRKPRNCWRQEPAQFKIAQFNKIKFILFSSRLRFLQLICTLLQFNCMLWQFIYMLLQLNYLLLQPIFTLLQLIYTLLKLKYSLLSPTLFMYFTESTKYTVRCTWYLTHALRQFSFKCKIHKRLFQRCSQQTLYSYTLCFE